MYDDRPVRPHTGQAEGSLRVRQENLRTFLDCITFSCACDHNGKPRTMQRFRSMLNSEADRFEYGEGWRGDSPQGKLGIPGAGIPGTGNSGDRGIPGTVYIINSGNSGDSIHN